MTDKLRRPRRIAADEAHAWARNLRLGNPYAKLVLSMLTLYVDGNGICFVGIETLAEDTELSTDTVRKRLVWLETVGAVARFPQWLDASGRRNSEARGKRTSDEIRLLINADSDLIEARAKGDGEDDSTPETAPVSPSPQPGLNPVGPVPALCQPSDSGEGLTSEPEPEEIPPYPPSGGEREAVDQEFESDLAEFKQTYPGPITDLPRLRTVFGAMAPPERRSVLTAVAGYASFIRQCNAQGKPRAVKDAHRWVSGGQWQGYLVDGERAVSVAQASSVPINSEPGKALVALHRVARMGPPMGSQGSYFLSRPLSLRGLAFAQAPPESEWQFISEQQPQQCAAWNGFIANELAGKARPPLISERVRVGQRGFMAPWPWPPLKDGSLCTGPPEKRDDVEFIEQNQGLG